MLGVDGLVIQPGDKVNLSPDPGEVWSRFFCGVPFRARDTLSGQFKLPSNVTLTP